MTNTYYLLLAPPFDELVAHIRALGAELCRADQDSWSELTQESSARGVAWVSRSGKATMRVVTPSRGPDGERPGWAELSGLPSGGRVRWVVHEPPRLVLIGLDDEEGDRVWSAARALQAAMLRQWVRTRGHSEPTVGTAAAPKGGRLRSLFEAVLPRAGGAVAAPLPRVAGPPFAPDEAAEWLFAGEVSSLGREIEEAGVILGGIAHKEHPERRLLVRPRHRMGAQSIVPVTEMSRGQRFVAARVGRSFDSAQALAEALREPLTKLLGATLPPAPTRERTTPPSIVNLGRFVDLEHREEQPFREFGAVAKLPSAGAYLRLSEVRTDFAAPGAPSATFEIEAGGLRGESKLFAVGERRSSTLDVRLFALGPGEEPSEILTVVEQALR